MASTTERSSTASGGFGCWSKAWWTTPSTCSIRPASSPTGMPGPSGSRAIGPMRSLASTSAFSIRPRTVRRGSRPIALETARREGKFAAEGWRIRKDGTRFLASVVIDAIYEHGVLIGFAKITRDISERQTAQSALHDSERNFRLLVNGVTDYALYMLDPEGMCRAGMRAASGSRAIRRRRSSASTFPASTPSRPGGRPAGAGAFDCARKRPLRGGRLACPQGRHVLLGERRSSIPSATTTASWSALPRSPATSPSGAMPRSS